eukprot:jgi/Mesvir1/15109/Mv14749-RA.1
METSTCPKCLLGKTRNQFTGRSWRTGGVCRQCYSESVRAYRSSEEGYFSHQLSNIAKSLKAKGREVLVRENELVEIYREQGGPCAITGIPMHHAPNHFWSGYCDSASVDLIDPNGPYTKQNIRLVCNKVRHMKGADALDSFVRFCGIVTRHQETKSDRDDKTDQSESPDSGFPAESAPVEKVPTETVKMRWSDEV